MSLEFISDIALPILTAIIALALIWHTWRFRMLPGVTPFLVIAGIVATWSVFNTLEQVTMGQELRLIWDRAQFGAIVLMPATWLILALDYTGKRSWLRTRSLIALFVIPLLTVLVISTNHYHDLMQSSVWLSEPVDWETAKGSLGPWNWVYATYSYGVSLATIVILAGAAHTAPRRYRAQPLLLLGGFVLPVAWNVLQVVVPEVLPKHDFTPAFFIFSEVLVIWALLRFRLFTLVPVARDTLVESMNDGLLVLDEAHRVVDFNEAARKMIGQPAEAILGRPATETWEDWEQLAEAYGEGARKVSLSLEQAGSKRDYEVTISPVTNKEHVLGRLLLIHDVTERSRMEESLRRQALTDSLTGLPNRTLFMVKLDDAMRQARRSKSDAFAVVVLDLDRFKLINDSIGHLAGDFLLENVASRLLRCVRDVDVVARMGGDEFMMLLRGTTSAEEAIPVVERIQCELDAAVQLERQEIASSASIGVATYAESYKSPEDLLRAADTAMYQAKEAGGSCYRVFDEEMHDSALSALQAEIELRAAIKREDFTLVYQPIVDIRTGVVCALESLLRWRHKDLGMILPSEFIRTAESSGLIVPLGSLALEKICRQISNWRALGSPATGLPVSINISARQLIETNFAASILDRLAQWKVKPETIALEVTETAFIRDPLKSKQAMMELREAGVSLCLDDFGAGWSSLRHLTTFPVQYLKIDSSFISRIAEKGTEFEIIRAVTGLAHSIGLEVTGEGVEEQEQLSLLTELGCDYAQGYLLGRPMEPHLLSAYLVNREKAAQRADAAAQDPVAAPVENLGAALSPTGLPLPSSGLS